MAQNRPDKPQITLPDDFGGTQEPFSSSLVESGYEASIPQIIEGGNLNWMLNGFFQNTKYMRTVLDYVRDTPVGKMFWVNSQGQMDYVEPAIIATNTEFSTGTATDKTPNVKQVVDKLATKQATITGAASTVTTNNLTASRAVVSNASGKLSVSSATTVELNYLSGVTSAIQTQINAKAADNAVVKLSGNQTISGTKTFSSSPVVPTQTYTDNSTKAASTAFVKTVLDALYPVNSIYITVRDSCPLAVLISGSTWEKVGTSIITNVSIPSSIAVYGNGKVIGLTNGTNKYGMGCTWQNSQLYTGGSDDISLGTSVSNTQPNSSTYNQRGKIGLVTDTNGNSGIVAKSNSITKTSLTVNIWQRTA